MPLTGGMKTFGGKMPEQWGHDISRFVERVIPMSEVAIQGFRKIVARKYGNVVSKTREYY
jgi:hypothetical protein